MVNLKKYKEIEKDFLNNKIDVSAVAFYDSEEFKNVERNNPSYLENYAKFVQLKQYDSSYLNMVREKLPFIAELLYKELKKDGRLGACVDLSLTLSRILEKEGIWNHIVFGSLNIDFPPKSNLPRGHFWTINHDNRKRVAAHAWLVVPPFRVVDLTVKIQRNHSLKQRKYLPDMVLSEKVRSYVPKAEDLINDQIIYSYKESGIKDVLALEIPKFKQFNNIFPAVSTKYNDTLLHYIPTAISAPDGPLEEAFNLELNGRYGYKIYQDIIQPALI
ncbi:hypothetical protein COE04_15895 [Bacillus cereus]|nr:hypothetical protein COE04_15895 [Bacillus cereus]